MKKTLSIMSSAIVISVSVGAASIPAGATDLPGDIQGFSQPTSVIDTIDGPLSGLDDGSMISFLGIPYAQPPIGELRWMPPKPVEKRTSVRLAEKLGSSCLQNGSLGVFATPGGNEDCLYLNIYAEKQAFNSARATSNGLPVLVWIHGGALHVGQGADYNPRALAADGKAIVVTINYRLGMFGFLAHPSLDKEGHAKANYGQMDQNQALRWVHENIGSFGGDASNVTIAGESSGGTSVIAQVLSPWSKGLFQNAIEMSGAAMMLKEPNFGAVTTLATAQRKGEDFAKAVGCNDPETAPACLRALDPSQVLAKQEPYLLAQTVIDGEFLPDWPSKLLETGNFNRVKLVSGNTLDEGDFFVALPELASGKPLTKEAYPVAIRGFHGEERAEAVLKQYPLSNYLNPSEAFSSTVTDYLFACPGLRLRDMATAHTDVWSYEFSDRTSPSYAPPVSFDLRAAHTFELPYIFPGFHGGKAGLPVALNPMQEGLASRMQAYWSSVAEAEKWKDWPGFKGEKRLINQFALSGSQTISSDQFARTHHCDFWNAQKVY